MHLSNGINCAKVKLVSYHQFLRITNSISCCFLGWNLVLRNISFLPALKIQNAQDMSKETIFSKIFQEFRLGSAFYGEGSQLWAVISQTFLGKNTKFLCSLDWKFPEFFKTHPTFVCSFLLKASRSFWTLTSVFFGTPCTLSHVCLCWTIES